MRLNVGSSIVVARRDQRWERVKVPMGWYVTLGAGCGKESQGVNPLLNRATRYIDDKDIN